MTYEKMIKEIQGASKDDLKMISFEMNQELYDRIKKLDVDKETKRSIILIVKDSEFFANLVINSLK